MKRDETMRLSGLYEYMKKKLTPPHTPEVDGEYQHGLAGDLIVGFQGRRIQLAFSSGQHMGHHEGPHVKPYDGRYASMDNGRYHSALIITKYGADTDMIHDINGIGGRLRHMSSPKFLEILVVCPTPISQSEQSELRDQYIMNATRGEGAPRIAVRFICLPDELHEIEQKYPINQFSPIDEELRRIVAFHAITKPVTSHRPLASTQTSEAYGQLHDKDTKKAAVTAQLENDEPQVKHDRANILSAIRNNRTFDELVTKYPHMANVPLNNCAFTFLHLLADKREDEDYAPIVARLIAAGADPNARDFEKKSPLHIASARGNNGMVRALLQNGATLNLLDSKNNYPIMLAVYSFNIETVGILVKAGADVRPTHTYSPMQWVRSNFAYSNIPGNPVVYNQMLTALGYPGTLDFVGVDE